MLTYPHLEKKLIRQKLKQKTFENSVCENGFVQVMVCYVRYLYYLYIIIWTGVRYVNRCPLINKLLAKSPTFAHLNEDLCARSRYQEQGQVITPHSICGM